MGLGEGRGGLCRVVCGREGALKGLDENRFYCKRFDHARLVPGLILFLRGFVSGGCYTFFFFVKMLDIVLFFG